MAPWFDGMPGVRVSVGFTSAGRRSNRIGECWAPECDEEGRCHIFIHPALVDPVAVASTLAHELIHAAIGIDKKHGPVFKKAALRIGLAGKMRSTTAGPVFVEKVAAILDEIGAYPHGALKPGASTRRKQGTRMLKLMAPDCCGYVVRTTQKWIDEGMPLCPHSTPMERVNDTEGGE